MFLCEWIIPGSMIRHPVEDHVHAQLMGGPYKMLEVGQLAKFRIDRQIILNGIGTAQAAFAILFPDGVDRHQPEDIRAEVLQARELRLGGAQRSFVRELAEVDLVDRSVSAPGRMLKLDEL